MSSTKVDALSSNGSTIRIFMTLASILLVPVFGYNLFMCLWVRFGPREPRNLVMSKTHDRWQNCAIRNGSTYMFCSVITALFLFFISMCMCNILIIDSNQKTVV